MSTCRDSPPCLSFQRQRVQILPLPSVTGGLGSLICGGGERPAAEEEAGGDRTRAGAGAARVLKPRQTDRGEGTGVRFTTWRKETGRGPAADHPLSLWGPWSLTCQGHSPLGHTLPPTIRPRGSLPFLFSRMGIFPHGYSTVGNGPSGRGGWALWPAGRVCQGAPPPPGAVQGQRALLLETQFGHFPRGATRSLTKEMDTRLTADRPLGKGAAVFTPLRLPQ